MPVRYTCLVVFGSYWLCLAIARPNVWHDQIEKRLSVGIGKNKNDSLLLTILCMSVYSAELIHCGTKYLVATTKIYIKWGKGVCEDGVRKESHPQTVLIWCLLVRPFVSCYMVLISKRSVYNQIDLTSLD